VLSSIFKKNNPEAMRPVRFLRMLYSANNVPFYQNKNKAEGPDDLDASSDPVRAFAAAAPGCRSVIASRSLTIARIHEPTKNLQHARA
jgi:hypothetical protein